MTFEDRYVSALASANLRDDARHAGAEALAAAALAERGISGLLVRVRATGDHASMEQLQAAWFARVVAIARARKWAKVNTPWAANSAFKLFRRIAESSLAVWLDDGCKVCNGNSVHHEDWDCAGCNRTGIALIPGGDFERDRVKDMVSELRVIEDGHTQRAARLLR